MWCWHIKFIINYNKSGLYIWYLYYSGSLMIRRFSNLVIYTFASASIRKVNTLKLCRRTSITSTLWTPITYRFADMPKHQVLKVTLSPLRCQLYPQPWAKEKLWSGIKISEMLFNKEILSAKSKLIKQLWDLKLPKKVF